MSPLLSCSNCWYNGLQYGPIGGSVGYCTEHRVILRAADATTCGRQRRKDLLFASAQRESNSHRATFPEDRIVYVRVARDGECIPANGTSLSKELEELESDPVGRSVVDFNRLDTKIGALAQLRNLLGARAELAMLSLGRSYVFRCSQRQGAWTSGLHLVWWLRQDRLEREPDLQINDLRWSQGEPTLRRHRELASWSLVMLRLAFLSDVATHARDPLGNALHPFAKLADLAEEAAVATQTTNLAKLMRWVRRDACKRLDAVLPASEYDRLAGELRQRARQA
ncbi:MAG: hypothetical protein GXP55_15750 [Deltaproteobacteria bacterium]|nr:hypothetical protein [Deltaproteobacteria bacterium]